MTRSCRSASEARLSSSGAREDRAAGILRIAQEQKLRVLAYGAGEMRFVEYPAARMLDERHVVVLTRRNLHRALEVLVDRGRHQDMLVGGAEMARSEMQPWDHAGQKHDPGRLDRPAVELLHALDDRLAQDVGRRAVAEYPVRDARGKCFEHRRRRAKVGIGDPERYDIAPGVALPARGPGSAAVDRRVEIEWHALWLRPAQSDARRRARLYWIRQRRDSRLIASRTT